LGIGPNNRHTLVDAEGMQVTLVAKAGFEPAAFKVMSEMVNMFDYFSLSKKLVYLVIFTMQYS